MNVPVENVVVVTARVARSYCAALVDDVLYQLTSWASDANPPPTIKRWRLEMTKLMSRWKKSCVEHYFEATACTDMGE